MKKIVSLVMAVVMCLSIAVVETTSASAKSINYKGFHVEKRNFNGNSATSYFTLGKLYNANEVFVMALTDNTSIKKIKHIKKITCNNKNLKISSNNFYFTPHSRDPRFEFKKTGKTKINFSYKYKKKTLRTSINVHVYGNRMALKVTKYSKHGNNYKLKFKVINEIKPNTFYVKSKKRRIYLSKNKTFSTTGKGKGYNTPTTFIIYDKNGSSNPNAPAYNYKTAPTYITTTMHKLCEAYYTGDKIYVFLHERNYFLPQR